MCGSTTPHIMWTVPSVLMHSPPVDLLLTYCSKVYSIIAQPYKLLSIDQQHTSTAPAGKLVP